MGVPELVDGHLPLGRHVYTLKEAHLAFVEDERFAGSTTRAPLWAQLDAGLRLLGAAVSVYQLWLAGSFISGKTDPGDVDVTFLIDGREHFSRPPEDRMVIEAFIVRLPDPVTGEIRRPHNLARDSFVVDSWPFEPRLEEEHQPWASPSGGDTTHTAATGTTGG